MTRAIAMGCAAAIILHAAADGADLDRAGLRAFTFAAS
jgi:hypothetical protein